MRGAPPVPPVRRVRAPPPAVAVAPLDRVPQPRVEAPDHMHHDLVHTVRQEGVPLPLRQPRNVPEARRGIGNRHRPALDHPGDPHPVRQARQHVVPAPRDGIQIAGRAPIHRDRREPPDRDQLAAQGQAGLRIHPPPIRHLMGERPDITRAHQPPSVSR